MAVLKIVGEQTKKSNQKGVEVVVIVRVNNQTGYITQVDISVILDRIHLYGYPCFSVRVIDLSRQL